ncbi:protein-L-isoaspartate(D-aspartate) O-methyltransferase [Pelagibacterium montanilacus]|uniref:protein-L-isoaspartate(D-aspartate) O-methyltransferase n=1 Tax=Pelagibacterium montanilacus TaxID=2185280 RepID=UPI000F8C3804|nr:protein-L-isoaspartate(D-aspartate) O-methyltransferase [Pelagibacterium montanilacus]
MAFGGGSDEYFEARAGLILLLRQMGVTDSDILNAFESVPHERFVPDSHGEYAYRDRSLPIGCGQSITAPTILAGMIVALVPLAGAKVLEVGSGSGYSAALMGRMARRVFSMERHPELAAAAQARWRAIGSSNIVGISDDGLGGLEMQAPFDRILVNGSVTDVPEAIGEQLADGGVAVLAVGPANERQVLLRIERADDILIEAELGTVRLPPLVRGRARPSTI